MTDGSNDVAVCYLHHADTVASIFMHSLLGLCMRDMATSRRILNLFPSVAGTMGLPDARNQTTRTALNAGAEWVFWVDSDMGFESQALDMLLETADPQQRPIVGGLTFGQLYDSAEGIVPRTAVFPVIYRFVPERAVFERASDYPRDTIVRCDATGAAFLLVHRSVFDKLAEDSGVDDWFTQIPHPNKQRTDMFGEDVSFCLRAGAAEFPIHVDTAVKTQHLKSRWLDEALFDMEGDHIPNFAVIPTVGKHGYVKDLVLELEKQGQTDRCFVIDNGAPAKVRNWLDSHNPGWLEVLDMPDAGIHEMWNAGMQAAQRRRIRSNIAFLNDDIRIGPDFMALMGAGLRARWDVAVVSPNYDGRDGSGLVPVTEICAGKYDGTGGLAGFAFMLRGESCYLFPHDMKWWYGDNDLLLSTLKLGRMAGIVLDVTCEHIDGGSQSADWDSEEVSPQLELDRLAFEAKWFPQMVGRVDA